MKVLVAGGSGLLGTHIIEQLCDTAHHVTGTFFRSEPRRQADGVTYVQVDLRKMENCRRVAKDSDVVFLCAAETGGRSKIESSTAPVIDTLRINAQLLEACAKENVQSVFLVSSTTIYPEDGSPFDESQGFDGDPPASYLGIGWMNRYLEKLASYYCAESRMSICILRPTNMYGPYDDFSETGAHVLPDLIRKFLTAKSHVEIWGDGSERRDFIYVEDVAKLLVSLIGHREALGPYNIGTGQCISIKNLSETIRQITSKNEIDIRWNQRRSAVAFDRCVDISRATFDLGFSAKHNLGEGLEKTVNWYKKFFAVSENGFGS